MHIEGNNVSNKSSQNILTCAQILMYCFIPRTKPQASISENMSKRYHSQNKRNSSCYVYIAIDLCYCKI